MPMQHRHAGSRLMPASPAPSAAGGLALRGQG